MYNDNTQHAFSASPLSVSSAPTSPPSCSPPDVEMSSSLLFSAPLHTCANYRHHPHEHASNSSKIRAIDYEALYKLQAIQLASLRHELSALRHAVLTRDFKALGIIPPPEHRVRPSCIGCFSNNADVVLECGHVVFCSACSHLHRKLQSTCPNCRLAINDALPERRIYM